MIWLVWRRQRAGLLVALGLAALVAVAAGTGRVVAVEVARAQGLLPCLREVRTGPCETVAWPEYVTVVSQATGVLWSAMLVLPLLAGVAAGAGLFGRELERGTHVFALSQGAPRLRWWTTGLLVAGLPVAVAVGAASVVAELATRPFRDFLISSPLNNAPFLATGILPVIYTLLAFVVAAVAGLVLRNVLAAVAVAVAVQVVVIGALSLGPREQYLPPLIETAPITFVNGDPVFEYPSPDDGLDLGYGYLDAAGREVGSEAFDADVCRRESFDVCLRSIGVVASYARYQPAERYWPFQAIESGIVLALVAGTLGVGLWGLRRRVH